MLIECKDDILDQTVEFIKWQKREDNNYSFFNPLLSNENNYDRKTVLNDYIIPNTFYCKVALKSYEAVFGT